MVLVVCLHSLNVDALVIKVIMRASFQSFVVLDYKAFVLLSHLFDHVMIMVLVCDQDKVCRDVIVVSRKRINVNNCPPGADDPEAVSSPLQ